MPEIPVFSGRAGVNAPLEYKHFLGGSYLLLTPLREQIHQFTPHLGCWGDMIKKEQECITSRIAVHLKLTQHCKSTILPHKIKIKY